MVNKTTQAATNQTIIVLRSAALKSKQSINKLAQLARLPRLYKLVRIFRVAKMIRLLKYNNSIKKITEKLKMNPGYIRMARLTLTVCFLVHLVSCGYFMVDSFSGFEPGSWVVNHNLID